MSRQALALLAVMTACGDGTGPGSSSAGTIMFVSAHADSVHTQLYLLDLDGSAPRTVTSGPASFSSPAVSPDGRQVLAFHEDGALASIYLMNIDGSNLQPTTVHNLYVWSPTGSRVVSVEIPGDDPDATALTVSNPDGTASIRIVAGNDQNFDPSWSPDGARLAYQRTPLEDPSIPRIWIVDADGGNDHPVTPDTMYQQAPAWSPDGSWIAFTGLPRADGNNLSLVSPDGNSRRELPGRCELGVQPRWSPDGTRIACLRSSVPNAWPELLVVNAEGGGADTLTQDPFYLGPSWSPDGQSLLLEGSGGGSIDAFLVRADGSSVTNLTRDPTNATQPVWVP